MAVIKVTRHPPQEGVAEAQRNNLFTEIIGRRYRIEFTVQTNSHLDGSNVVLKARAQGVPQIGDMYKPPRVGRLQPDYFNDEDILATCIRVQAYALKSRFLWRVVADYDTDRIVAAVTDDPFRQPAELSWHEQTYEKAMLRDAYGVPCVTTSNNHFDPPLVEEEGNPVLRITRNERTFTSQLQRTYNRKYNKLRVGGTNGWGPLEARINSIEAAQRFAFGIAYFAVTYEVEFNRDTFAHFTLDRDFRDVRGFLFRDQRDASPRSNETLLNGRGEDIAIARTKLVGGIGANDISITITPGDWRKFPPPLKQADADGVIPGPYWYYKVLIDSEVLEVTGGIGTDTWNVTRGMNGTTPAAHSSNADVILEPYFLRFLPKRVVDFTPLALPIG